MKISILSLAVIGSLLFSVISTFRSRRNKSKNLKHSHKRHAVGFSFLEKNSMKKQDDLADDDSFDTTLQARQSIRDYNNEDELTDEQLQDNINDDLHGEAVEYNFDD